MPNGKTHLLVGAGLGFTAYVVCCRFSNRPFTLSEALLATGSCVLGSVAPDFLEPAIHSWHRGACHSIAAGGAIGRLGWVPWAGGANPELGGLLASFFALGYLSHLFMDASTPRSVPLLK